MTLSSDEVAVLQALAVIRVGTTAGGGIRGYEPRGRAVLVHTGWSAYFNSERYFEGHPFLTADAAAYLRDCGVRLVGIDSHHVDDTRGRARPVHSTLLREGILIVEHLTNLAALPDKGFSFSAIPPKTQGVGTFPVRAFARLH